MEVKGFCECKEASCRQDNFKKTMSKFWVFLKIAKNINAWPYMNFLDDKQLPKFMSIYKK